MKPATLVRRLLVVSALSLGGVGTGWLLTRARNERGPVSDATALPVPRRAERRPFAPLPENAAPRPQARDSSVAEAGWIELNNEATTDLTEGDLVAAVEKFERCHEAEPANAVFAGNLVEALVRLARVEHERGALEAAVDLLARAIRLGSERQDIDVLRQILERWRRELELGEDDWTEGSSRFELTYDTDRNDILHHSHEVLEHLELCYEDLVRWFGRDPLAGQPATRVVLYDPEDFDRLTGLGDWAAGVFDGVVRVSVRDLAGSQSWKAVLKHELVHAFLHGAAGLETPGWLNEGVAQWLEGRPPDHDKLLQRLAGAEPFPLEKLAGSLAAWKDSSEIGRAYAQSLLFVEYLSRTYGDESLRKALFAPTTGESAGVAFERYSGVPMELAFQDWTTSLRH